MSKIKVGDRVHHVDATAAHPGTVADLVTLSGFPHARVHWANHQRSTVRLDLLVAIDKDEIQNHYEQMLAQQQGA